jgi:hypothetical protein
MSSFLMAADKKNSVHADLKTVTIYSRGAELVHTVGANLKQGNNELMIEGISNQLDINSIQINCPRHVTIMSIEFSNNYLDAAEISPRIRFLNDSLVQVQSELNRIAVSISTASDLLEVLKANRDIKGSQSGLSVAELMKLIEYYKLKSNELQNEISGQKEKQKVANAQVAKLKNQISEEEQKNTRTAGRIHLQLYVALGGHSEFMISYITQNAFWTPYYDIRIEDIKSPLKVVYKAKMVQTTGIDWKRVKLSLSTSVPYQWGNAPLLKSWFLSYINPVVAMDKGLARNRIQSFDDTKSNLQEVVITGYSSQSPGLSIEKEAKPLYVVNGAMMNESDFQKISPQSIAKTEVLTATASTSRYGSRGANGVVVITLKDGLEDYVSVTDNELNVVFDIDLPYDVPSNGKEQTATLKEYAIESFYKYYGVPKLDKDAYLLAEVADWEKLNLLPGEANIVFEGTYVGKSFIDPASTADTLNLTLGRDKRVVIKREKMVDYSSVKLLGSNKLQKITYELTVKNNKKDAVKMMLKDQFPVSTDKDIEVDLLDSSNGAVNKELGILTWRLELQPGESKNVRFAYTVKYPKDKSINLH